ncbi:tyrosine-type recombinase/integrase [Enterobacter ludwigii]|uniref:tyrosine-type recombinase/integrase n=1 Tax=Enterobacter ludwigii TaxID=299767 RepID=UPI003976EC4D
MKLTRFPYISHTDKDGFVWKKRIDGNTIYISLKTRDLKTAQARGVSLTGKWVMCKPLNLSFMAMKQTLRKHRDEMVDRALLETLEVGIPTISQTQNVESETVAQIRETHSLTDALEEWCKEMKPDWKPRTEKLNRRSIDLFIEWAKKLHIHTIEDVNKEAISSFKKYLDERYEAPRSRQDALIKVHALFSFCVDKRDWLQSNPVKGMLYSKVVTVNEKTEISPETYSRVMEGYYVNNYQGKLKELLMILWNTGMRIGEAIQLRPEDFRNVDGVKVISINDEDGKSVKNASSIRNIPVNHALTELYDVLSVLPKGKPVLGWNKNNAAASHVANAFKQHGLNHSTHDFRYSLSNRLRDCSVPDSIRYSILGHAHSVTTDRVYKTRSPLLQMKKALDQCSLDYTLVIKNDDAELIQSMEMLGM